MPATLKCFLMTEKGLGVLAALVEAGLARVVSAVVVGRDRAVADDRAGAIVELARASGIVVYERAAAAGAPICDYAFAVSWRWMLRDLPERLIVFHDSPLPRYRGFAPLVSMLVVGEPHIGVTCLYASDGYDEGDVIAQAIVPVRYPIKIAEAIGLLLPHYGRLAVEVARALVAGDVPRAEPQDASRASYSLWRDAEDYRVDWRLAAEAIARFVDAVGPPYGGAECRVDGRAATLTEAEVMPDVELPLRHVGKVLRVEGTRPVVVCGAGLLRVCGLRDRATGEDLLPLRRFRTRFT